MKEHTDTASVALKTAQELGDLTSLGIAVGTVLGFLPYLAALLTVIWTGLRIFDWIEARSIRLQATVKVEKDKKNETHTPT
ncbi:hypothetical protein [Pyruvatibacter sp.]